jgi:hypothetical protein
LCFSSSGQTYQIELIFLKRIWAGDKERLEYELVSKNTCINFREVVASLHLETSICGSNIGSGIFFVSIFLVAFDIKVN